MTRAGVPFRGDRVTLRRTICSGSVDEEAAGIDLDAIFDPGAYLTHLPEIFERLERLRD